MANDMMNDDAGPIAVAFDSLIISLLLAFTTLLTLYLFLYSNLIIVILCELWYLSDDNIMMVWTMRYNMTYCGLWRGEMSWGVLIETSRWT